MKPSVDMQDEDVTAPSLLDRDLRIPQPYLSRIELVQQGNVVAPGQFCNGALHDYEVWPRGSEGPPPWRGLVDA
jgi:hypothetical protein